jgi:hypothetical protein
MQDSTKQTLVIGASVLIASVGLFFIAKAIVNRIKSTKEEERNTLLEEEIENSGGSSEQQQIEEAQKYDPKNDVKFIGDKIIGGNIMYYPDEINSLITRLNDIQVKKLADAWKNKYKRSLYADLDDEWDSCGTWGFSNCYQIAMTRLSNLGKR